MAYLGNAPKGNLLTMNSSQFSGDNSETNFTLSQTVTNTNEVEVFVGNVRQDPHSAYTISGGTTLAFTAAPPTGTISTLSIREAGILLRSTARPDPAPPVGD